MKKIKTEWEIENLLKTQVNLIQLSNKEGFKLLNKYILEKNWDSFFQVLFYKQELIIRFKENIVGDSDDTLINMRKHIEESILDPRIFKTITNIDFFKNYCKQIYSERILKEFLANQWSDEERIEILETAITNKLDFNNNKLSLIEILSKNSKDPFKTKKKLIKHFCSIKNWYYDPNETNVIKKNNVLNKWIKVRNFFVYSQLLAILGTLVGIILFLFQCNPYSYFYILLTSTITLYFSIGICFVIPKLLKRNIIQYNQPKQLEQF